MTHSATLLEKVEEALRENRESWEMVIGLGIPAEDRDRTLLLGPSQARKILSGYMLRDGFPPVGGMEDLDAPPFYLWTKDRIYFLAEAIAGELGKYSGAVISVPRNPLAEAPKSVYVNPEIGEIRMNPFKWFVRIREYRGQQSQFREFVSDGKKYKNLTEGDCRLLYPGYEQIVGETVRIGGNEIKIKDFSSFMKYLSKLSPTHILNWYARIEGNENEKAPRNEDKRPYEEIELIGDNSTINQLNERCLEDDLENLERLLDSSAEYELVTKTNR